MSFTHAVILLAGTGSRLKPLTDTTHKALIPIGNESILQRQIQGLKQSGVRNFHLVLGHRSDDIIQHIQNHSPSELNFQFHICKDYLTTNNACSLHCALKSLNDGFILMDGDVILDIPLLNALQKNSHSTFIVDGNKEKLDEEAMKVFLENNQITHISKKIPVAESFGESIGVAAFSPKWTDHLKKLFDEKLASPKNHSLYYEDIIQMSLSDNSHPEPLGFISTDHHKWVEIDDHNDLQRAKDLFVEIF